MRSFSICLFALGWVVANARGEWRVVSTNSESSSAVEHRTTECANGDRSATVHLALFSPRSGMLRVIDNGGGGNVGDALRQNGCVAGVNGGYFDPDFKPIGLRVNNGVTSSPLVRAHLLTGVLFQTGATASIARLSELGRTKKVDAAVECGPMLVEHSAAVRTLNNTRPARRTFAATTSDNKVALGFCSDVTLAELGAILSRCKMTRALNLDGGSSSAFWFQRGDGSAFSIGEYKSVRDAIGITPRR